MFLIFVILICFQLNPRIEIRQFYRDVDNRLKPGNKGIALEVDQWAIVKDAIPQIDKLILIEQAFNEFHGNFIDELLQEALDLRIEEIL